MKLPTMMIKMLQATIEYHLTDFVFKAQLSYNHMQPYGWKHIKVPRRAPINETRPPNTGIALAIRYAITVIPLVHPSQVPQCTRLLEFKCFDPRKILRKMYLAGTYKLALAK